MKKPLIRIALSYIVKNLQNIEIDKDDRMEGYAGLYANTKMMNNLEKMLVEDTKQMMKKDCMSTDRFQVGMRHGMFIRTYSIKSLAKQSYEEYNKKSYEKNGSQNL